MALNTMSKTALMKGSEAAVECLRSEGVNVVFGLAGLHTEPILDVLYNARDIRYISVRHEQVATFMACGYAKVSRKPGVCLLVTGPGLLNAMSGIGNALIDSDPLVLIVGGKETDNYLGEPVHGDAEWLDCVKPITKWSVRVPRVDKVTEALRRAFRVATSGDPGPVCVEVPADLWDEKSTFEILPPERYRIAPRSSGDEEAVKRAAELLLNAENPVIIAGGGSVLSDASAEIRELAELLLTPVATTYVAKGIFPEDHPLSLGILNGLPAKKFIGETDVILAVGCGTRKFSPLNLPEKARVIQVDIDAERIGKVLKGTSGMVFEVGIVGDAKAVLSSLAKVCEEKMKSREKAGNGGRVEFIAMLKKESESMLSSMMNSESIPLNPIRVMKELGESIERDAIVSVDNGNNTVWASYIPAFHPRRLITSSAFGSMGFGFPGALGAKVAAPERQVVCVTGDGGFMMTLHDLETAVRCNIPVVVMVLNDYAYGMTRLRQKHLYGGRYMGTEHSNPDFVQLAESFGAYGERVEKPHKIRPAILRALKEERVSVLDIIVDREQEPEIMIKENPWMRRKDP